MNLQDQVIYRCIHAACARPMPRKVNFCPYCGTGQHDGLSKPAHVAATHAPAPAAAPVVQVAPPVIVETVAQQPAAAPPPMAAPAQAALPQSAPVPPVPPVPRTPSPAQPPRRQPIRLRYWLIALGLLALVWYNARPNPGKLATRLAEAIAMAEDCRSSEAQAELFALRAEKATPEQLQKLQAAMNAAAPGCERKRAKAARPKPVVKKPVVVAPTQSARKLIDEAEQDIARGNYKGASDKLEACVSMVEDNRECAAYKLHADRLLRERQRCVASNNVWVNDKCK